MLFMKKELLRVFTDKKLIMSLFLVPVVLLVVLFGLMGTLMSNLAKDIDKHVGSVYIQNQPKEFEQFSASLDLSEFKINYYEASQDTTQIKQDIKDGNVDLLIVFEDNFMDKVKNYNSEQTVPQINTYYNASEDYSSAARESYIEKVINGFKTQLLTERFGDIKDVEVFGIDTNNKDSIIQDDNKANGKLLGMLVPYMVTILLFSSVMSVGMDAIAGEKERGTMATLLLTPANRKNIIVGKMMGLTLVSILSALMYAVAAAIGMPVMMASLGSMGEAMSFDINYTPIQIIQMLVIILLMATNYVGLVALLSAICKNIKEATSYIAPVQIIIIVAGIFTMYGSKDPKFIEYLIPVYNCSLSLKAIFIMEITMPQFLTTVGISLALTCILVWIITKVFNSEKLMLNA